MPYFDQTPFRARLLWGRRGARVAAERGDVLVVVDVLSFSTAVTIGVERGAVVYPCAEGEDPAAAAAAHGAEPAVRREDVPARGRFSLSPETWLAATPGDAVVLPSPNGATCARYGRSVATLLGGSLRNASAAAAAARRAAGRDTAVTVLACGERWPGDGTLRFALEDYLGAGAVLGALELPLSPEAEACAAAFRGARLRLAELLRGCGSGVELRDRGWAADVELAARLDAGEAVPALVSGGLRAS